MNSPYTKNLFRFRVGVAVKCDSAGVDLVECVVALADLSPDEDETSAGATAAESLEGGRARKGKLCVIFFRTKGGLGLGLGLGMQLLAIIRSWAVSFLRGLKTTFLFFV